MPSTGSSEATPTYTCGRCRQPLIVRVTAALASQLAAQNIGESQYDLLASQITSHVSQGDRALDPGLEAILQNEGGPLISRKVVDGASIVGTKHGSALQSYFDTLGAQSEADHPLCTECAKTWFAHMSEVVEEQRQTRELLVQYEKDVEARKAELDERNEWLQKDTASLEKEEEALKAQLLQMEAQKMDLDKELRELDEEERALELEEKECVAPF